MNRIQWTLNAMPKSDDRYLSLMSINNVDQARADREEHTSELQSRN